MLLMTESRAYGACKIEWITCNHGVTAHNKDGESGRTKMPGGGQEDSEHFTCHQ